MSFVVTRFEESITINNQFAESLIKDLNKISNPTDGTILVVADKIFMPHDYEFNYKQGFPGRYDLILIADSFDSQGRIDLSGSDGDVGKEGDWGCTAFPSQPCPETGHNGSPGKPGYLGTPGLPGKNINILVRKVENIELISNGGKGGQGGQGGQGGNGEKTTVGSFQYNGGDGGSGANGQDGEKAGRIGVLFCNKRLGLTISQHLTSIGGGPGGWGEGGQPGQKSPPSQAGSHGGYFGIKGEDSKPEVNKVDSREFWEKVIGILAIPSG